MSETSQGGPAGALAVLGLIQGPRYGEELAIPAPVVVVGRAARCDVVIADDSVSATHARLEFDHGAWRITDLDSANGTSVEGVRLAAQVPTPLPYGSTVRLGGVKLQFRAVREADPAAARAEFVPPPPPKTLREESRGFRLPVWLVALVLVTLVVLGLVLSGVLFPTDPVPMPVSAPAGAPAPAAPTPAP